MTVVVVGSLNADLILSGGRIPRPGETTILSGLSRAQGGKGANQAAVAGALGADVRFIGAVGADEAGGAAADALRSLGVDVSGLITLDAPTGLAVVMVDEDGENAIGIVPGANAELTPSRVREALAAVEASSATLLVSLEIPLPTAVAAVEFAHDLGWTVVLNPAPAQDLPAALISLCTVLTPNEGEAARLSGADGLLASGAGAVVVTRGADGATVHEPGRITRHASVHADVVDTTGAGDAFSAGLAVALDRGHELTDAVRFALACGAIATEGFGARGSLPTTDAAARRMPGS